MKQVFKMSKVFAICDIGCRHLLMKNGRWIKFPIEDADLPSLETFQNQDSAESFCLQKIATNCHCRPYGFILDTGEHGELYARFPIQPPRRP